jgi:hypothetical protein
MLNFGFSGILAKSRICAASSSVVTLQPVVRRGCHPGSERGRRKAKRLKTGNKGREH